MRSLHFVPAGKRRMLDKALGSTADALILDLEDSVAPEAKVAAREEICRWLAENDFGSKLRVVRINALATPWGEDDLAATSEFAPDLYMVPKVESPYDLERIDAQLRRLPHPEGTETGLIPIATETPTAVLRVAEIAGAPRVRALTWGAEDLSAALGAEAPRTPEGGYREVFRLARSLALLAAAAAHVDPIDSVYVDIADLEGLRRESEDAAAQGFVGKMTIHPDQIEIVNRAFTPTAAAIERATEMLEAYEQHRSAGHAAFRFRGEMVDAPHLERARRLLARVEAANAKNAPAL